MKKITQLFKKFIFFILILFFLLISINISVYVLLTYQTVQNYQDADLPVSMLEQTTASLKKDKDGEYHIDANLQARLTNDNIWGMLIDNETGKVVWGLNVPTGIPLQFNLTDISQFSRYYLEDYPVFTWEHHDGLLVLAYPKDSYVKINLEYTMGEMKKIFYLFLFIAAIDLLILLFVYLYLTKRMNRSISPIIEGITNLSEGKPAALMKTGAFSEIAESINRTSAELQQKNNFLIEKEKNRENWIEGISHDIRTPLSIILGYSEKLKNTGSLSKTDRQLVNVMAEQSIIIKELIENLNLVSHLESKGLNIPLSSIFPLKIVRQIITEILNSDLDDKYQIIFNAEGITAESQVLGEESLLKRAISNLILNSMKHNPEGCEIYVSIKEQMEHIDIVVEDTGKGITQEQFKEIKSLFNDKQNISPPKNRKGLGLLIVKEIVAIHKGKVNLSTPSESGLKTVISIPVIEKV